MFYFHLFLFYWWRSCSQPSMFCFDFFNSIRSIHAAGFPSLLMWKIIYIRCQIWLFELDFFLVSSCVLLASPVSCVGDVTWSLGPGVMVLVGMTMLYLDLLAVYLLLVMCETVCAFSIILRNMRLSVILRNVYIGFVCSLLFIILMFCGIWIQLLIIT